MGNGWPRQNITRKREYVEILLKLLWHSRLQTASHAALSQARRDFELKTFRRLARHANPHSLAPQHDAVREVPQRRPYPRKPAGRGRQQTEAALASRIKEELLHHGGSGQTLSSRQERWGREFSPSEMPREYTIKIIMPAAAFHRHHGRATRLGRFVALKFLPDVGGRGTPAGGERCSPLQGPQALGRFRREARVASALRQHKTSTPQCVATARTETDVHP
jgi:hypothetical protein